MKSLIVVGNDKLGRRFINSIDQEKYHIVLDESSSINRILKLVKKKVLRPSLILKMFIANLLRQDFKIKHTYESINTNNELIQIIKGHEIEQVILYRGGLIINKNILDLGIEVLNIHCAKIPEYGGIGVIDRALKDKAYDQEATLHIITEKIDDGEIIAIEPYKLKKNTNYRENEDIAYAAGIKLFNKYIKEMEK